MKTWKDAILFILMACVFIEGALIAGVFSLYSIQGDYKHGQIALIQECEATLPRNKSCILVAIPQEEKQ